MKWCTISYFCLILISPGTVCNKIESKEEFLTIKTKMDLHDFSQECKKYIKKELRRNWKIHKTGKCYFQDDSTRIKVYDMQNCFIGKSKEIIHDIFGLPTRVVDSKNFMTEEYFLRKNCSKLYSYDNWQLFFLFENNSLTSISMDQISFD